MSEGRTVRYVIDDDRRRGDPTTESSSTPRRLLADATIPVCSRRAAPRRVPVTRLDETLLDAARFVLTSIELLSRFERLDEVRGRMVRTAYEDAHADAPRGAIGVTCVLAHMLRRPDERELAFTLHRARGAFTREELIAGAATICGTVSQQLAARLDLDPTDIMNELATRRLRHRSVAGDRCRHHRLGCGERAASTSASKRSPVRRPMRRAHRRRPG